MRSRRRLRDTLAPLLCGAATVPAFAPFELWPLAPLMLAALLALWHAVTPRRAAGIGYLYGLGLFSAGVYWVFISVHVFGGAPAALAAAVTVALILFLSLYPALVGWLYARLGPAGSPVGALLVFPAVWALTEWLRSWMFSGFPWLSIGYSQSATVLAAYAPVLGIFAVSLGVALTAGGLYAAVISRSWRGRAAAAIAVAAVWLAGAGLGEVTWTRPAGEPLSVALAQGNISQNLKWDPDQLEPTLATYRRLTARHRDADLVVWPEAAVPALYHEVRDEQLAAIRRDLAADGGPALVLGVLRYDAGAGRYYNTLLHLAEEPQFYIKRHLVPFGEYFPVPDFVRQGLKLLELPYTDFAGGPAHQPMLNAAGAQISGSICYEAIFGAEMAHAARGSELLINASNDAWFGDSIAPHQHLQIARFRALETGRVMLRATNTGITAILGPKGRLRERIPQFRVAALAGTVQPRRGMTPYMRVYDWPLVGLAALLLGVPLVARRWRRSQPDA